MVQFVSRGSPNLPVLLFSPGVYSVWSRFIAFEMIKSLETHVQIVSLRDCRPLTFYDIETLLKERDLPRLDFLAYKSFDVQILTHPSIQHSILIDPPKPYPLDPNLEIVTTRSILDELAGPGVSRTIMLQPKIRKELAARILTALDTV